MSYDFALERTCPHQTLFERVQLDTARYDTIPVPKPIANASVRVDINGVNVPPGGLYSDVVLSTIRQEPFRIVTNQSDLICIKIGSDPIRLIPLVTGSSVRAADLALDLSRKIPELKIIAENGRVIFKSPDQRTPLRFPDPRWTDKTSSLPSTARILGGFTRLGIVPGRVVSSQKLYPSWSIIQDETSPLDNQVLIRFSEPIRNNSAIFRVSYFTDAQNCRRCVGTRVEFDYGVLNGTYESIDGADLLLQEWDKFLFTRIGSHFKWPWLGSKLSDRIGGKGSTARVTAGAMITLDMTQAFSTYQSIKYQQEASGQRVTDAEYPYQLGDISVQSVPDDPTIAMVQVMIHTRSRNPVVLKRVIGTPDPFFLAGSTQGTFRLRG